MESEIPFTKEDLRSLTRLDEAIKGLSKQINDRFDAQDEKIDSFIKTLNNCQDGCKDRRVNVGRRIDDIETDVQVLKDERNQKIGSDKRTVVIAGIVGGVVTLIITVAQFVWNLIR